MPASDPLAGAFALLATYGEGSDRGTLTPLDEAIHSAGGDPAREKAMEKRLLGSFESKISALAKEYLCGKLASIGSAACVPSLARLLADATLSYAARNALEAIGTPQAVKALRGSLGKLTGTAKAGVIRSLGRMRDTRSVETLTRLLEDTDPEIAASVIEALGNIASPAAAEALRAALPKVRKSSRPTFFNACLICVERLQADGRATPARALWIAISTASPPAHVGRALQDLCARLRP